MNNTALILLAAGASRRMGQTKQLLPLGSKLMIQHAVEQVLGVGLPIYLVLGAEKDKVAEAVAQYPIHLVFNPDWEFGLAHSITAGMRALPPSIERILIALADQPSITTDHFKTLVQTSLEHSANPKVLIASAYPSVDENIRLGVPALFGSFWFPDLLELQGDQGAQTLLRAHISEVIPVVCPNALNDIDTPTEYATYLKQITGKA